MAEAFSEPPTGSKTVLITNVNPIVTAFLLLAITFVNVGCSTLHRTRFFTPSGKSGQPVKKMVFLKAWSISGRPIAYEVGAKDATLTFRISQEEALEQQRTVAFGPMWLPVVPTLLNWFRRERNEANIVIQVTLSAGQMGIRWIPNASSIQWESSNEKPPLSVESWKSDKVSDAVAVDPNSSTSVYLEFPFESGLDEFDVRLSDLEIGGALAQIETIRFTRSKGWAMGFAP